MSKQEQIHYSGALKDAAGTVGKRESLEQADKAYGALKRAEKGLAEEPSIPRSLFQLLTLSRKAVPGSSLSLSTLGQVLDKTSKGAKAATSAPLRSWLDERDGKE